MVTLVLFVSFAIMLFANVPIAAALGLASILALKAMDMNLSMVPMNYYTGISKFVLLAIPFFILGGNIMEKAGISERLIRLFNTLVGHIHGGLAIVCVGVACFFAAISGSGPATVAAMGIILIPAMKAYGYKGRSAAGLMATAGSIGVIIPPSITFVIYGSITGVSISKLFMAGIIPGLLMGFMLIIAMYWVSRKWELKKTKKATPKERFDALKDAIWALLMPVIILGGIYGGVFTPTEAAAVSAVYGLAVGIFIYRTITFKSLIELLTNSMAQTAGVMFITASASLFAWVITVEGIAANATELLIAVADGNLVIFLIIVNVLLLIAGCFLDGTSSFYIFTPILLPVANALGYDPIALGVVMVMNLAIGMVTPPVGVCLYTACGISGETLKDVSIGALPFIVMAFVSLLIVTYVPQISLFLPSLLK